MSNDNLTYWMLFDINDVTINYDLIPSVNEIFIKSFFFSFKVANIFSSFSFAQRLRMGALQSAIEWLQSLFWKQEMELTLVGLQNSGKTTLVNVLAVSYNI